MESMKNFLRVVCAINCPLASPQAAVVIRVTGAQEHVTHRSTGARYTQEHVTHRSTLYAGRGEQRLLRAAPRKPSLIPTPSHFCTWTWGSVLSTAAPTPGGEARRGEGRRLLGKSYLVRDGQIRGDEQPPRELVGSYFTRNRIRCTTVNAISNECLCKHRTYSVPVYSAYMRTGAQVHTHRLATPPPRYG